MLLLIFIVAAWLIPTTFSAGKCITSNPPKSWAITKAIGIEMWATAGVRSNGTQFCVTRNPHGLVEVDYHLDLPRNGQSFQSVIMSPKKLWDNPDNKCVNKDRHIRVCFPFCRRVYEEKVVEAFLQFGAQNAVHRVAKAIEESLQLRGWGITVLQVDYTNPKTKLNATMFTDVTHWCSVYVGADPAIGKGYLYEIQLGKLLPEPS